MWNPKPLYIFTSKEFLLLFYLDCLLSAYAYTSYAWQQVCNKWPERNKCILKNDQNHGRFSAAGWYAPILATQICRDSYSVERATFNAIEHVPPKTQHNDSKIFSLANGATACILFQHHKIPLVISTTFPRPFRCFLQPIF